MDAYRFYVVDSKGRVFQPPRIANCKDDAHAIRYARLFLDRQAIEIWEGARRVMRLEPKK